MADASETRILVDRWRAGDQQAARQLFDRYAARLMALARRQIGRRIAGRVDPEDVVQSVFRTFFERVKAGQFRIEEQDDLGKLLVRITVHKTLRKVQFHQAAKREQRPRNRGAQAAVAELVEREHDADQRASQQGGAAREGSRLPGGGCPRSDRGSTSAAIRTAARWRCHRFA